MIETIFAFIAGTMLSWPALVIMIILGILFEHNGARGFAVFTALVTMVISYFFFSIPLMTIALGALAYIVIGLVWSFYRYKRHAIKVVEQYKDRELSSKSDALRDLHPTAMLSTITAWILIWPFSMVENVIGDIINSVQLLVTKVFRGLYYRIYDAAVAQLK